jgi:hypothetical protein
MIDRQKRDVLAEKLRHLLSGQIENLLFDDLADGKFLDSRDEALWEIFHSIWYYYDDFRSQPLRLTEGQRLALIRCVAFLHSDFEFEWSTRRRSLHSRCWGLFLQRETTPREPAWLYLFGNGWGVHRLQTMVATGLQKFRMDFLVVC